MKLADFKLQNGSDEQTLVDLIAGFNRTKSEYPRDRTVHAVFSECAARYPNEIAVHDGTRFLTYAELDRASNRLARRLLALNVPPEGFVSVLLDNSLSFITAILGIFKAGAAYCPIETDASYERARYSLTETRGAVLITEPARQEAAERLRSECPSLSSVVMMTDGRVDNGEGEESEDALPERAGPGRLAYVMYTSGTSGRPKGVLIEHRSILRLVMNTNFVPLDRTTRVLMTCSVGFDVSVFEVWGSLLHGGLLVRPGKAAILDPLEVRRLIAAHAINTMWLTGSLFNHLVDADASMFAELKYLLVGGERLSPPHIERARRANPGLILINGYGPTENATFTTCHTIDRTYDDIPIGTPISNTEVLILDGFGALAPPGITGEIVAGGDGLARGYLNDPALTADRFRPHPLQRGERIYLTRDRGRWTDAGVIEFFGRMDSQVKIRGYRIEPAEIEARLHECPGVEDAAVIVTAVDPADSGSERAIVAYVTGSADAAAVRTLLRSRLPAYMVPRAVMRLDRFPLNLSGKLDAAALPAPDWTTQFSTEPAVPCETETERQLADIWKEVVKVDAIGATDNFFDLGGHSLSVTKLVALIHQRLGIDLPLGTVFKAQTVREMARALVDVARLGTTLADDTMVLLGGASDAMPVFAFPPGTGDVLSYIPLAARWPDCRVYAFNFIEADSRLADYADLIASVQPDGSVVLLGYSAGGNLAFHVAAELERRGRRVSRIVMIDSGRMLAPYPFLEDAVRQAADDFLAHPTIQPYCGTPVLRDKVARKITAVYRWLSTATDTHVVAADIHVVLSAGGPLEHHLDGQLIASVSAWASATRGKFETHDGRGTHNEMLFEPAVDENARLLRALLVGSTPSL